MGRRALLLINRNARRGRETEIVDSLKRVGIEVVEDSSASSRNVTDVIRRHRHDVNLVIVAGGDGSLHAAAPGLVETGLTLGILPLGTANDLARTLNLPAGLPEACAVIAKGTTRRIDLGQANDKFYFNVASVGISARIARALDAKTKRVWGSLAYARTAFRVAMTARSARAEIRSGRGSHLGEDPANRRRQWPLFRRRHVGRGRCVDRGRSSRALFARVPPVVAIVMVGVCDPARPSSSRP